MTRKLETCLGAGLASTFPFTVQMADIRWIATSFVSGAVVAAVFVFMEK